MASFFRGIDIFREWNIRIHPELDHATSAEGKAKISNFPADGLDEVYVYNVVPRTNLQVRQDVGGYMAGVINELLELLKNTPTNYCSDAMYNTLRANYYGLVKATADAEEQELRR